MGYPTIQALTAKPRPDFTVPGYTWPPGSTAVTDATVSAAAPARMAWFEPTPSRPVTTARRPAPAPSRGSGQQKPPDWPVVRLTVSWQNCGPDATWASQYFGL